MGKVMNSTDFINKAKDIANNYKTLYVMGCFGAPMNATNKKRYANNNSYNKNRATMINNATSDTFGFDCVCLIKGILWGWNGNVNATYGGAKYESNGVPDFGTEGMLNYCTNVSSNFKNIEVGEVLWLKGHAGIYIGNGLAVECTPKWKNKVQITAVKNIGTKKGYESRKWTKHGKLNYIEYQETKYNLTRTLKKGCKGSDVKELQETLINKGYSVGKYGADSSFGNDTLKAVKSFQKANKLTQDGIVGPNTAHALGWLYKGK